MVRVKSKHLVKFESSYFERIQILEGARIYRSHENKLRTIYLYLLPITTSEGKVEVATIFTHYEAKYHTYCQYLTTVDEVDRFFHFIHKSHRLLSSALIQDVRNFVQSYVIQ